MPPKTVETMQINRVASVDGAGRPAQRWYRKPHVLLGSVTVIGLAAVFVVVFLYLAPTAGQPDMSGGYQCESSYKVDSVAKYAQKGIAIDDDTFQGCPNKLPRVWPNADEPVRSIRLFKAWDPSWPIEKRDRAWTDLAKFARNSSAKVMVGTQISCSEEADDADWDNVLDLLKILGPEYVMGVAVGNELELLQFKDKASVPDACVENVWKGGYLQRKFEQRVQSLDDLGDGFEKVPVTSVFGAAIMSGNPFWNVEKAMVLTFLKTTIAKYGTRYVHSLNVYPYFDPGNALA